MKRTIYFLIILILIQSFSFAKKERNKRSKRSKNNNIKLKENYNFDDIEKLQDSYYTGNEKSLKTLIAIYEDKNQSIPIRIIALETIADSNDPDLKIALEKSLSQAEFVNIEIMKESVYALVKMQDKSSTDAFIKSLSNSESKIMDLRATIMDAIGENNTEDKVLTLLELYEISLSNHQRMNELLTLTLGQMDDNRAIPILMDIAQNQEIDLRVRNRAIDILSRKNAPELVDFFIELLGSPSSNDQMLNFINNSMGIVEKDRLMLALLESYETGKNRYHAVLYSTMNSLEDYNNPNIKPVFLEIAKTDGFPKILRIKAINALGKFNDPLVLDDLILLLENNDNYDFYYEIMNLAKELNVEKEYSHKFNLAGYKAMQINK